MILKLKDIYLFESIDDNLICYIIDNARRVEYVEGDSVIYEWQASDNNAYIIQSGKAIVEKEWEKIASLKEWDIFWEIALITNEKRTATIRAETDLILLKINKELLHKIIKEFKNWKKIQEEIIKRIKENNQKTNKSKSK